MTTFVVRAMNPRVTLHRRISLGCEPPRDDGKWERRREKQIPAGRQPRHSNHCSWHGHGEVFRRILRSAQDDILFPSDPRMIASCE
jgi:hypothetical protein